MRRAPRPSARARRPYGRPEGMRAIAVLLGSLAACGVITGGALSRSFDLGHMIALVSVVACAAFEGAAREETRRIASGAVAAGSRWLWTAVTVACGAAVLSLVLLRPMSGETSAAILLPIGLVLVGGGLLYVGLEAWCRGARAGSVDSPGPRAYPETQATGMTMDDASGRSAAPPPPYRMSAPRFAVSPLVAGPIVRAAAHRRSLRTSELPAWAHVGVLLAVFGPYLAVLLWFLFGDLG